MAEEQNPRVLVVDDERNTREGLKRAFQHKYQILLAANGKEGLEVLDDNPIDVVLVDLRMPKMDGLTFIRKVNASENPPLIIMFTAYGTMQIADEAMKEGAYDYLTKPLNLDNLEMVIDRGLETQRLREENQHFRQELDERYSMDQIVGNSSAMNGIFDMLQQIAPARTTVLLTGESGTGKELIAHAIHGMSPRNNKPFIVVHCASLNPNLLESELFGHEKGAFTGASERHIGRFERADKGTLFLDEIGELDTSTQIKLLRVLETHTFERVGGTTSITTNTRLVTATNRDLKKMVADGEFREDLYYRLNVLSIDIPPLRERPEDIPPLLDHFLQHFAAENGKKITAFSPEAMKVLTSYNWPGNVRELRNCVERMVVMARSSTLTLGDVPADIRTAAAGLTSQSHASEGKNQDEETGSAESQGLDINMNERNLVKRALEQCDGNRTRAAEQLGISRRTLHRKLKAYDIS
ncbi:MAG: sigma-54 dependent transcriptional regulator [Lentisphaeria bacterium]